MKARLLLDTKTVLSDGRIIQRKIWHLPEKNDDYVHGFKYSLYCGLNGKTIVRYDNEKGKGDHRHIGPYETEMPYSFVSLAKLLTDFAKDIETLSGTIE